MPGKFVVKEGLCDVIDPEKVLIQIYLMNACRGRNVPLIRTVSVSDCEISLLGYKRVAFPGAIGEKPSMRRAGRVENI